MQQSGIRVTCSPEGRSVPKAVFTIHTTVNPIEKCLWILRCKFHFTTMAKMRSCCLTSVERAIAHLSKLKYPALISVNGKLANYDHVLIVWRNRVIDYESEDLYPLTEDSLRLLCGNNTSFQAISVGYGLFPPKEVRRSVTTIDFNDWGISEYYKDKNSKCGRLFTRHHNAKKR